MLWLYWCGPLDNQVGCMQPLNWNEFDTPGLKYMSVWICVTESQILAQAQKKRKKRKNWINKPFTLYEISPPSPAACSDFMLGLNEELTRDSLKRSDFCSSLGFSACVEAVCVIYCNYLIYSVWTGDKYGTHWYSKVRSSVKDKHFFVKVPYLHQAWGFKIYSIDQVYSSLWCSICIWVWICSMTSLTCRKTISNYVFGHTYIHTYKNDSQSGVGKYMRCTCSGVQSNN